jgi:hypothetical protein
MVCDQERIEKCGAKLTTKKDRNGFEYQHIEMDESKKEWVVRVQVVRTYRISVFADDVTQARRLASVMQTLQLADEGKLEDIEVTNIHVEGDERNGWDGDDGEA